MSVQAIIRTRSTLAVVLPLAGSMLLAAGAMAQPPPKPGPTAPETAKPEKRLPVPRPGDDMVLNPTLDQCKAGWRTGMKWTKDQFDRFCRQLEISK